MTVAVAPRYKTFVGNDTTGPFSFTFPILLSNSGTPYITVKSIDADGVETTLAFTTGYTFTPLLLGKGGGIVTTIAAVPSDGSRLFVEATTPLDQGVGYSNQGGFFPETHENSYDKIHFILIENVQKGDLSVKFPSSEIGVNTILPVAAQRANTSLGFDGNGDLVCGSLSSVLVSVTMTAFVQSATLANARTALGLGSAAVQDASAFWDYTDTEVGTRVLKTGDTMTGNLNVPSLNSGSLGGFRNKIINGNFAINDWSYVSGAAITSGAFGHNRWKAGSGGGAYTFTQAKASTQITITAGSLIQVIEDANVEGGTYTLSWTGTATAKVNGGTAAASPITVTGLASDTAITVEFLTGTVGLVQLETGVIPTTFERRGVTIEELLCARYLPVFISTGTTSFVGVGTVNSATVGQPSIFFKVPSRVAPTGITVSNATHFSVNTAGGNTVCTNVTIGSLMSKNGGMLNFTVASGLTAGQSCFGYSNNASGKILFTGCEL